jgi:hypothetical protein
VDQVMVVLVRMDQDMEQQVVEQVEHMYFLIMQ